MKQQTDAPEKPKPTAEERLQLARARHAEAAERLEQRSEKLTAKVVAREQMEDRLRQERVYRTTASEEFVKAEDILKEHRATWQKHNRRVVSLEFKLGIRKRGQAAVAPPPAEVAADAQGGQPDEEGAAG